MLFSAGLQVLQMGRFYLQTRFRFQTNYLGDVPNEFYIVLSGAVGIFSQRDAAIIEKEGKIVEKIKNVLKKYSGKTSSEYNDYGRDFDFDKLEQEEREYLNCLRKVGEDGIIFNSKYLEDKLGNLPSTLYESSDFFHYVNILDNCLEWSIKISKSQQYTERRNVR